MPSKPLVKPRWATPDAVDGFDIIQPPENKKNIGWLKSERPPFQFMNWLFKNIYDWIDYLSPLEVESLQNPKYGQVGKMENIGFFIGGAGNGTITIKQANGSDFADTPGNRGYVWLRSPTNGKIVRGMIKANVSLAAVGAHWGADTKGDLANAILRVYAINDGHVADDFTPIWGLGLQGGFQKIRNNQDSTVGTDINTPHEILVNVNVVNDNSPMSDVGYVFANYDDTGNINGEDFWTFISTHPGESADGIKQPFNPSEAGFASFAGTGISLWTMFGSYVHMDYQTKDGSISNANGFSLISPIYTAVIAKFPTTRITNNGVILTTSSFVDFLFSGSSIMQVYKDGASAVNAWTAANGKGASFSITYPAYQP